MKEEKFIFLIETKNNDELNEILEEFEGFRIESDKDLNGILYKLEFTYEPKTLEEWVEEK